MYAHFAEVMKEVRNYLLGISIEGRKGSGWKRHLFVWPFIIAVLIVLYLIAGIFV